jgi:hypothetical protein
MKTNLVLALSGVLLLAAQVNAQEQPNVNTSNSTSVNVSQNINMQVATTKNGKSTSVVYGSNYNPQDEQDDTPMKAKTFSKSFAIDKSDKVNLSNQYGSITVKTWSKNEIKVDVDMKAYAKTADEAQKLIDDLSIEATKSGDLVTFKTERGDRNGNWGSSVRNGKTIWRREIKVHYVVYMPSSNSLTASQQYGNITMDDFTGPTSLKLQYGDLIAANLSSTNNYISIQYGKGSVKDMGGATIKHQYGSGITIASVGNVDVNAQYTAVKIGSVKGTATIKHQYGNGTTIGSVSGGSINVNTQYAPIKITNLNSNLTSRAQYSKVIVDEIEAGKDIDVDAQYSSVSLGFASNYAADLDVRTQYGSFKYGENVTARKEEDGKNYSSNKNYTGQIGKGGNAKVMVKVQYDNVTFK